MCRCRGSQVRVQPLLGVFTVREVAQQLKLSEWSVRREVREGRLRAKRIGRCQRITATDLERWLETDDDNGVLT